MPMPHPPVGGRPTSSRYIILVIEHGFIVARVFLSHLLFESVGLVFGIIQLAKAIGQFTATDKEFKTVSQEGSSLLRRDKGLTSAG